MKKGFMPKVIFRLMLLSAACFFLYGSVSQAAGPEHSTVTEEELVLLSSQSIPEAFNELKNPAVFVNSKLLGSGIKSAFSGRETEAVRFAINTLRTPRIGFIEGKQVNRSADFRVAKNIFQQFEDKALPLLERQYHKGAPVLRCNIIEMLGGMKQKKAKEILLSALDDTAICEDETPEEEGISLRVCDAAYNQLVLRQHLKGVLRSIGPVHKIEDRDYHIGVLKDKLQIN